MNDDYWRARWRDGRIGFHEGLPNAQLAEHLGRLGTKRRVLVPLCGKAEDLAFLGAHGHQVVGVELEPAAIESFFEEHGMVPEVTRMGPFVRYACGPITLFAGDFFASTAAVLGPVDALYDRAAIIALPPALRLRYAQHLRALLPAAASGLVITVEYPQHTHEGPPFSVSESELREHFAGLSVELVGESKAEAASIQLLDARQKCFHVRF